MSQKTKDFLLIGALVIGILVILWQLVNYLGARKLETTMREIKAELALLPPLPTKSPMPSAEENFFEAPLVSALIDIELSEDTNLSFWDRVTFNQEEEVRKIAKMKIQSLGAKKHYPYSPHLLGSIFRKAWDPVDHKIWAAGFRATDLNPNYSAKLEDAREVLAGLDRIYGEQFAKLEAAAQRPYARIPAITIPRGDPLAGQYSMVSMSAFGLQSVLFLRMEMALAANDMELFWRTFEIAKCFFEGALTAEGTNEIFLLSRTASFFSLFWLGIHLDRFSDGELKEIQEYVSGIRFAELVALKFHSKIREASRLEPLKENRALIEQYFFTPTRSSFSMNKWIARYGPAGLYDRNIAWEKQWIFDNDVEPWLRMDFVRLATTSSRMPVHDSINNFMTRHVLYTMQDTLIEGHVLKLHVELACAIERFQIAKGRLPDDQRELVPDFLKAELLDPFDKKPMRYQIYGDDYELYSIGADLVDGGGRRKVDYDGRIRPMEGDWVWPKGVEEVEQDPRGLKRTLFWIAQEEKLQRPLTEKEIQPLWVEHRKAMEKLEEESQSARNRLLLERAKARIKRDREEAHR